MSSAGVVACFTLLLYIGLMLCFLIYFDEAQKARYAQENLSQIYLSAEEEGAALLLYVVIGLCVLISRGGSELAGTVFWSLQYVLFVNTFQLMTEYRSALANETSATFFTKTDKAMLIFLITCGYLFTVLFWTWICCIICIFAYSYRPLAGAQFRDRSVSRQLLGLFEQLESITPLEAKDSGQICAICLEEADNDRPDENQTLYKRLPCRHIFHAPCLMSWFSTQLNTNVQGVVSCPHCRSIINP